MDQVIHDYGDLCQAITELAFEQAAPFETKEFRTLNRCLDNAIADAVTEFTYQLVQGFDFYWLHKNKQCRLQMGGSDQWGNIVTGTELIRKKSGGEAFAFT